MVSEANVSKLLNVFDQLVSIAGASENTRIMTNLEVIDAAPADLPAGYIIVKNEQGFYGPVLKLPGLSYTNGDLVNVLFVKGTEPVAMQQGSGSAGSNGGAPIDAQYLTLATNTVLTNERVFTPSLPLVAVDGGAGSTYTLSVNAATEAAAGVAPIATQAEVNTGTDDTLIVTPLKLATRLATIDVVKVSELWESDGGSIVVDVDATGNVVFNDASVASRNWRMESNNNADMFNLLGNSDVIIIGGATQQQSGSVFEVHGSTGATYAVIHNGGDTSVERDAILQFRHSNGVGAQIAAYRDSGNSDGMTLAFATEPVGGSLTNRMYIGQDGRIGVGGLATLGLMHFQGAMSSGGLAALFLDPTTSGSGTMYGLRVVGQTGTTGFIGIGVHGGTNLATNWVASIWIGNEASRPGLSIGFASGTKAPVHGANIAGPVGVGAVHSGLTGSVFEIHSTNVSGAGSRYVSLLAVGATAQTIVLSVSNFIGIAVAKYSGGGVPETALFTATGAVFDFGGGNLFEIQISGSTCRAVRTGGSGTANFSIFVVYI